MIPIFINNRNRLTSTKAMVEYLWKIPDAKPIIIDNESTWPPLLEWYATLTDVEVVRLERNVGSYAPWECCPELRKLCYYVVTDSDLDLSAVPLNVLDKLKAGLERFPQAVKAGLSLEIEDIPAESPLYSKVRRWESQFWTEKLAPEWWWCMVDTTFAMYRPGAGWGGCHNSLRSDRPYTARHLPWYVTAPTKTNEEQYYQDHCEHGFSSWISGGNDNPQRLYLPHPYNPKAEWHITYRCDLRCTTCDRACFLQPSPTPDMTLADAEAFIEQCRQARWFPHVIILGGEPTLHPDFFAFIELANQLSPGRVTVTSNGFSQTAKRQLQRIRDERLCGITEDSIKPTGSIVQPITDFFLAPVDFGMETRLPCCLHASTGRCGISVDSQGYTLCPAGGAIDGMLQLSLRTKRLVDLFDPMFATNQTREMCRFCGAFLGVDFRRQTESQLVGGTLMSKTWVKATGRF